MTRTAGFIVHGLLALWAAVCLLRPVFGQRASGQEEAAFLDGASRLRIYFEIVLPMAAAAPRNGPTSRPPRC